MLMGKSKKVVYSLDHFLVDMKRSKMQWTTRRTWILKLEGKECKVSQIRRNESSLACIKPKNQRFSLMRFV